MMKVLIIDNAQDITRGIKDGLSEFGSKYLHSGIWD